MYDPFVRVRRCDSRCPVVPSVNVSAESVWVVNKALGIRKPPEPLDVVDLWVIARTIFPHIPDSSDISTRISVLPVDSEGRKAEATAATSAPLTFAIADTANCPGVVGAAVKPVLISGTVAGIFCAGGDGGS